MGKHLHYASVVLVFVLCWGASYGQSRTERLSITEQTNTQKLTVLQSKFKQEFDFRKAEALRQAEVKGWETVIIEPDGGITELMAVTPEGRPIYFSTENRGAAETVKAHTLYNGGSLGLNVEGQNMLIGVWDGGGIRTTHELFNGRVTQKDNPTTALSSHGTHVSGTLIGNGAVAGGLARGMAHQATLDAYDWNGDEAEVTDAAANGLLVSSHSYGVNAEKSPLYYLGKYDVNARNYDEIMFNAPFYQMVCSAGNDQQDNINTEDNGYDKLTDMSLSKNAIVVAAVSQVDNYTGPSSVVMSNFSTWGPADDGRIKPDISAKGVSMYSSTSASDTGYGTSSGTSMATPSVSGSLLLLQQHYNNVNSSYMKAATLRGLALHTADEAGTAAGPDYKFGWGLLNVESAAKAINGNGTTSKISEEVLVSGSSFTTTVSALGNEPLMVTIAWTDLNGEVLPNVEDLATPSLVNDLDIRITKNGDTFFPWKLDPANPAAAATTGDNVVDNIEKVEVNAAVGEYIITVTHKGALVGGLQNFSLIVTGGSEATTICNATVPSGVQVSDVNDSEALLSWDSVAGAAYDVQYRATGNTEWISSSTSATALLIEDLESETEYEVQVRSKCDPEVSDFSNSIVFTTAEFVATYCAAQGNSVADEFISNVTLGSINNSSDDGDGYSDFTSISTTLELGKEYNFSITPTWTGTIYSEGYAIWIDYNGNGDFDDAGELVWSKAPSKDSPVTGSFTLPTTAEEDEVRMRVIMQYNSIPSSCGSFSYGEVEDYTIILTNSSIDTEAPSIPADLNVTGVTNESVSLSWSASSDNVGVTGYSVYQDGILVRTVTDTNAVISELEEGTTYAFTVDATDAAGNVSEQSASINATTIAPDTEAPTIPTDLVSTNVTESSLELSWTASTDNEGVVEYEIYLDGVLIATEVNTTAIITGLSAGTEYSLTVIAKDEAGNASPESLALVVSTFAPKLDISVPIYYEAETAADQALFAPFIIGNDSGACGGSYIEVTPGNNSFSSPADTGVAKYTFTTDSAGEVYVWMRVKAPTTADDSFHVSMDDGPSYLWNNLGAQDWTWKKVPQTYTVSADNHTLSIAYREDGTWLDKIYITDNAADIPTDCSETAPVVASLPWVEDFALTDGAKSDEGDTQWNSVSTGIGEDGFAEVLDSRFAIRRATTTWTSQIVDISSVSAVDIAIDIEGDNAAVMEVSDYIRLYYILDGGDPVLIAENLDGFDLKTESVTGISGSTVQVFIQSKTSFYDETYYIDNVSITESVVEDVRLDDRLETDDVKATVNQKLILYPNPTVNDLYVDGMEAGVAYEIYSTNGVLVAKGNLDNSVDVSRLARGSYVIRITGKDGFLIEPFIKQ